MWFVKEFSGLKMKNAHFQKTQLEYKIWSNLAKNGQVMAILIFSMFPKLGIQNFSQQWGKSAQ